ncbi:hypothetical protein [Micromonospora sp. WMMD1082]|uniref:hypothetical protein n=1 Tax=Micromonospora sp. WMMD1082 TaxID=3016104 RepID=UPI00241667A4|nr:hypothetical protein [Micromonospora sp. WMMD1082]MDG4797813.1 hypothetical protein [Micromonospora sp. WMMD1082]
MIAGNTLVLVHNCDFGPGAADMKYDKHVLGLDDAGNATRKADMPEYDYDGGFEQYVDDARALMCASTCPVGARETVRNLDGVTTVIRMDATGKIGMRVGDRITSYFRPDNPLKYFEEQANR